jgi:hypothetical protein
MSATGVRCDCSQLHNLDDLLVLAILRAFELANEAM